MHSPALSKRLRDGDHCHAAPVAPPPAADEPSIGELYGRYATGLRRYAERFVYSRDGAEDVVQEVFCRLWRRWALVDVGANIRAYLYSATRTTALDYLARERSESRRRTQYEPPIMSDEEPVESPDTDAFVTREEISRAIQDVLTQVPPRQRQVAILRFGRQLTTEQIAKELGMSPLTVKKHMARTMRALRERLPLVLTAR
jgi:RNA polymerase sigma-70 factor (ECF subfamily)